MQYSDVTGAQLAALNNHMVLFRSTLGAIARLCNTMAALDAGWQNGALAIVTALDAGAVISDPTGLAGAQALTREEVLASMANVESALAAWNTPALRLIYAQAAGAGNTIGPA